MLSLGLKEQGPMGSSPITWQEMEAWQNMTGSLLDPWEAEVIKRLSHRMMRKSELMDAKVMDPPWSECFSDEDRLKLTEAANRDLAHFLNRG